MHVHGPVPLNDPDYANRAFETRLVREVQAGNWVLLLGPRQHGKTSAFLRLRKTLTDNATSSVLVDLQKSPPFDTYAQLATWFARQVAAGLGQLSEIQDSDDLALALSQALPAGNTPVVILVDEASNIEVDVWRNAFYGQLRAISSDRATAADHEVAKRLRFVFAGTFRPERLVAEANSPFNICERIETSDLTVEDIERLARSAGLAEPAAIASMIHSAVGGQPYLNQKLIHSAVGAEDTIAAVGEEIEHLGHGESDHVSNLFRRVASDDALISVVSAVVRTGHVAVEAGNEDQRYLVVLGVLHRDRGTLTFRNQLYADVAARSPQFAPGVPPIARRAVLFPLDIDAFSRVASAELKEIAHSAQIGAVGAYQSGSHRIALAGFGTAMEAVLMAFLLHRPPTDLATANSHCNRSLHHDPNNPTTWSLINLMRGVRGLLGHGQLDIPENLREWRNLVHPGVCLRAYKHDSELAPEVCTAAGLLQIILRDLP